MSGFAHSMACRTEGIRAVAPVKWRGLNGLMNVFWDAEGEAGARAYYLSPDPRIVIFFNDVSPHIRMSNRENGFDGHDRQMSRAIYVPAGVPLWTSFTSAHRFSHLDLHVHKDRMLKFLSPSVGASYALTALRRPVEVQDVAGIETLAGLLVDEVSSPSKHAAYAENLVGCIAAGLLDISDSTGEKADGRLTQGQMNKLASRINAGGGGRLTVAEMAETVGLSESWFATVFRQTTGKTPQQWQLGVRIECVKTMLTDTDMTIAEISARLGFSDQAHLTKVFRQIAGETPAAWRRLRRLR